jgi:hypothetical protein
MTHLHFSHHLPIKVREEEKEEKEKSSDFIIAVDYVDLNYCRSTMIQYQ